MRFRIKCNIHNIFIIAFDLTSGSLSLELGMIAKKKPNETVEGFGTFLKGFIGFELRSVT